MHHLGATRSSLKADHLLQTPDTFIRTPLPGAQGVEFIVHAAPQLGACFTQMTAEFAAEGKLGPTPRHSRFIYVMEGEIEVSAGAKQHLLLPGGFAYLPQGASHSVHARMASRAAIIEKPYQPVEGTPAPAMIVGKEDSVTQAPLMGDESLRVRSLMPDDPVHDFAVQHHDIRSRRCFEHG